jgi:dTDP-4-dehydrorhamnose reductase
MNDTRAPLEIWGGVECTVNRVGDRWFDQLAWSGHDRRIEDLDAIRSLGIRRVRYPLLWERLAPRDDGEIDWRWADARMDRLVRLRIEPVVGLLHHGSGPSSTSLVDEQFPVKFARFAAAVAERYPWVAAYTPVNEPLTTARFSGLYGHWYPHARADRVYVRALMNQLKGVVLAMRAIREVNPSAQLVQTEDCGRAFGTRETRHQVAYECDRRWLTFDLLCGRVDDRHRLHSWLTGAGMTAADEAFFLAEPCPPDIVGLNYYVTSDRYLDERLERYPPSAHGGNGYVAYADVEAVRARPEGIAGHDTHLRAAWKRYGIPLAITEVHIGCTREEQLRWLMEAADGAVRARAAGVDVRAVTAWALFGSFNWHSLVTRDEGHYEPGAFDLRGRSPRPTALARLIQCLASGGRPAEPALAGTPWWRRSTRLMQGSPQAARMAAAPRMTMEAARMARRQPSPPPVLIVGSTGTLGRAFHRICQERGLASQIVGRRDVDITSASAVERIVDTYRPWAVVNAAGYVRVDGAERDEQACLRANVDGAVNLARACARASVRYVTFSSDLVFDGEIGRPYVEDDAPRPLNVYGCSKAEAERRVLQLLPEALVIRTSAFFGPWDEYNFLAALFRHVAQRLSFHAPADSIVSPTYVPDLAHAALDLLIDRESGLWHVANDGAVTWFELARMAAERRGAGSDLVIAAQTAAVWGPAVRPVYSALTSRRGRLLRPIDAAVDAYVRDVRAVDAAIGGAACASR